MTFFRDQKNVHSRKENNQNVTLLLCTHYLSDVSRIHYSSPYITVDNDGDDSSTSMDYQAENGPFAEVSGINNNRSTILYTKL